MSNTPRWICSTTSQFSQMSDAIVTFRMFASCSSEKRRLASDVSYLRAEEGVRRGWAGEGGGGMSIHLCTCECTYVCMYKHKCIYAYIHTRIYKSLMLIYKKTYIIQLHTHNSGIQIYIYTCMHLYMHA